MKRAKSPKPKRSPMSKKVKAAVKKEAVKAELTAIQAAANDINEVLGPEPALDINAGDEKLTADVKALLPEIKDSDDLQLATWKTLKDLGWTGKPAKAAPKAGKRERKPVDRSKCSKAVIYLAWKKGMKDVEKLQKLVSGAVKEGTIRSWLGSWKNGKNLPAVANG